MKARIVTMTDELPFPRLGLRSAIEFRSWLEAKSETCPAVFVEFYKDGTEGISYEDALDEALCFGWIDTQVRRIDERIYVRKFTKRRARSHWTEANIGRAQALIAAGRMTESGMKAFAERSP